MDQHSKPVLMRVDHILVLIIRGISYAAAASLIIIMLIAFFNVLGEKLAKLNIPFVGGIPMAMALIQYFHIPVVFLAAGFVTLDRGHTHIDMLSSHFHEGVQKFFITLGHLLGAGISFFISYRAFFVLMVRFYKSHSLITTMANAWPKWPFAFIHGLGFFILGISFIWAIVRLFWLSDTDHGDISPMESRCVED
ncbi:MAG: TRAP transporter small permease subunit [Spirochaetales bacterium]|nr:TRAP transporter small permease subunit [Spirochaetales bacterium]